MNLSKRFLSNPNFTYIVTVSIIARALTIRIKKPICVLAKLSITEYMVKIKPAMPITPKLGINISMASRVIPITKVRIVILSATL